MILGEIHADHFMFQFEKSSHTTIENDSNQASFLRMNDLIVALFQFAKDLDVFDEHCRHQLESGIQILGDSSGWKCENRQTRRRHLTFSGALGWVGTSMANISTRAIWASCHCLLYELESHRSTDRFSQSRELTYATLLDAVAFVCNCNDVYERRFHFIARCYGDWPRARLTLHRCVRLFSSV